MNTPIRSHVLHENGTFELQYLVGNSPSFEYLGTDKEGKAVITFNWGCCGWVATGSLSNSSLSIHYSDNMLGLDFQDGVYIRAQ